MLFRSSRTQKTKGGGSGENKSRPFGRAFLNCFRAHNHGDAARRTRALRDGKQAELRPNGEFANLGVCELVTSIEVNCTFLYAQMDLDGGCFLGRFVQTAKTTKGAWPWRVRARAVLHAPSLASR